MTWSFAFHGKTKAVRREIEKQNQKFSIEGEQKAYDAAKLVVIGTLDSMSDSDHVFVSGNGSAGEACITTTRARRGSSSITPGLASMRRCSSSVGAS